LGEKRSDYNKEIKKEVDKSISHNVGTWTFSSVKYGEKKNFAIQPMLRSMNNYDLQYSSQQLQNAELKITRDNFSTPAGLNPPPFLFPPYANYRETSDICK
jgi:hypothetical protein